MRQIKKTETMIKKLREIDPNLEMKTQAEFYGDDRQGIWFTGYSFLGEDLTGQWKINKNGSNDFEDWEVYQVDCVLNEKLASVLEQHGWSYDFYDKETVLAFYNDL
jgi:hypothetical protein|tara:strand:- start:817 stop:1134 length:318 start_codon:yes stop_codon:yes gene_type:complete